MEISFVSPGSGSAVDKSSKSATTQKQPSTPAQSFGPDYKISISAKVQVQEINVTYSAGQNGAQSVLQTAETGNRAADTNQNLLGTTREEIRNQVEARAIALLDSYLGNNPEVKTSLGDFFRNNPEAVEEISQGKIPDYFNVDNTARRILDIYFQRYDGGDRGAFVERAKGIINQAYGEVSDEVGGLPDIVNQTHEKIISILDNFAAGEDVSEFVHIPDVSQKAE